MELSNSFVVDAPVDTTWKVLTDLERVAPCLPGATLTGVDGDDFHGTVKIKVGPVTAAYEGTARFAERDDTAHRGVIRAEAREARGQGGASATITAELTEQGEGTEVSLLTDLALSGRVAQFGRGVISDVSAKLIGQFAQRLEREITSGGTRPGASDQAAPRPGADGTAAPSAPSVPSATTPRVAAGAADEDDDGLDLFDLAGPVLRRALPALGAAGAALLTGFALGRLGRRTSPAAGPDLSSIPAGAPVVLQLVLPSPSAKENA